MIKSAQGEEAVMESKATAGIRRLKNFIMRSDPETLDCSIILGIMSEYADCGTVIINPEGMRIFEHIPEGALSKIPIDSVICGQFKDLTDDVQNTNIFNYLPPFLQRRRQQDTYLSILPLFAEYEKIGFLLVYKEGNPFSEGELGLIDSTAALIALLLSSRRFIEKMLESRSAINVKSAIETLSYSELDSLNCILDELSGTEGLIVASKVADKAGITRSVIVNALRKLESAGLIESRSLGMKGTYIKILNFDIVNELHKFKK